MIVLRRLNVVKRVGTEEQARQLVAKGFVRESRPDGEQQKAAAPKKSKKEGGK